MKRMFVLLLSGVLLMSSMPVSSIASAEPAAKVAASTNASDEAMATPIIANEEPIAVPIIAKDVPMNTQVEPSDKALESVILAVKKKITIPKEYSEFDYYFHNTNDYSDSYWSLSWRNPNTYASIQVNCDVNNHIAYYRSYDYNNRSMGIAKYLKSELKSKAEDFLLQIAPEIATKVEFLKAEYEGVYSGNYVYQFQRSFNDISFPDNTVSISVNSITGAVTEASIRWLYDVKLPTAKATMSLEDAAKLIKDNMKMKLVYRTDYYGIYDRSGNTQKKAFLVYEPTLNFISIDAKTGEVYLTRSEWVETGRGTEKGAEADEAAADGGASNTLTEEELTKIEELKHLISKEEAIEKIIKNKYLYIDKNLTSYNANLYKRNDGSGDTSYIWNISFNDPRKVNYETDEDTYRGYAYATVDAESGKIISYYSSVKSSYDYQNQKWLPMDIAYDKKEGRAVLEKFLSSEMKDYFKLSTFTSESDDYVLYYNDKTPVYGGYNYQYNRVNEGVEYPYNGINGAVDGVTGKIYSVSANWDHKVVFESPKGAMSAEEAMDYYLSKEGYGLKYEVNVINKFDSDYGKDQEYYDYTKAYSVEYEVRLVYRPDVSPSYISPFTGEQLDYRGQVYEVAAPYTYKDITDAKKYRNILLLADMNIGFEGENFLPDQSINIDEMKTLLQKVGYGYYTENVEVLQKPMTRETLAQLFIQILGLEKMSKLQGIYKTGFADESSIDSTALGAVALAKGLGLMEGDSLNNFNPRNSITRLQAVDYLMKFIEAAKSGVMY